MVKIGPHIGIDLSENEAKLGAVTNDTPSETVVITGYAEITPLGNTHETAKGERKGISGTKAYNVHNFRSNIAAPINFRPGDHFSEKELRGMSRIGAMGVVLAREAGRMAGILDDKGKLSPVFDPLRAGCTVSSGIGSASDYININTKIHWKTNHETGIKEEIDPVEGSRFISPFAGLKLFPEEPGEKSRQLSDCRDGVIIPAKPARPVSQVLQTPTN